MIHNLAAENLVGHFLSELRDPRTQCDRARFRRNMERLGEIFAYEISRYLPFSKVDIRTPLGIAPSKVQEHPPVLATILRAGLPLHEGLLNFFDRADCAFIAAFRDHQTAEDFTIKLNYCSCPSLQGRDVIISDPMLATGSSMAATLQELFRKETAAQVHVVSVIACEAGITRVQKAMPGCHIWTAAIDPELNHKSYIVPGLGDAGDLAYGEKL